MNPIPAVTVQAGMLPHLESRPWRSGDSELLTAAAASFSMPTLSRRFLVGTPRFPARYVRSLRDPAGSGLARLAQVATVEGQLVGLAECVWRLDGPELPDLALLVADAWQRRGIGSRLLSELTDRCCDAGLKLVTAESEADNAGARALARRFQRETPHHEGTVTSPPGAGHISYAITFPGCPEHVDPAGSGRRNLMVRRPAEVSP